MKKLSLLTLLITLPLFLLSQNIVVKSFRLLENDMSARTIAPKTDQNGEKAALIKVITTQTGFEFDGGSLGIVSNKRETGECWVYVPRGAKVITIKHDKLGVLRNYVYPLPITAATVYELILVSGTVETIIKPTEIETQWLIINTKPDSADVYINDTAAGKTPYQNELSVGKYIWHISKELYLTDTGVVELTTTTGKKKIDLVLKPNFGSIFVKTIPEVNARVLINGMDVNKTTPCTLEKILSGDITISARANDYSVSTQSVKMTPGQNINVTLTASPTFGTIYISTIPEGNATVILNGKPTGKTTPCILVHIPAGEHSITFTCEWYETANRKVTLTAGQALPLNVEMKPTFAEVTVTSDPTADIYINSQFKSNGIWKGRLTPNNYTFEAKLNNHATATQNQTVIVGQPLSITLKPTPKVGTLKIISNPFEASITLNGKDYGTTPNTIKDLLIGNYTLTLKKSGYGNITKTITITENITTKINESLPTGMEVTITSTPAGAQLWVDSVFRGSTPCIVTLDFGKHVVKLIKGKKIINENITISQEGPFNFEFNVKEKFIDSRDGQAYEIMLIGGQTWMVENLNYDTGDNYPTIYGRLYSYQTANLVCPDGWHLPSKKEFKTLISFIKKSNTKNNADFNPVAGGHVDRDNNLTDLKRYGHYWSSTYSTIKMDGLRFYNYLFFSHRELEIRSILETYFLSVRCIQN